MRYRETYHIRVKLDLNELCSDLDVIELMLYMRVGMWLRCIRLMVSTVHGVCDEEEAF